MDVKLGCVSPWDKRKPHPGQAEFLSLDYTGPQLHRYDLVSGRGFGKTTTAVLLAFKLGLDDPGMVTMITSPTYRMLNDTFLEKWMDVVPGELYKYKKADEAIEMFNSTRILLRSRNVDNPKKARDIARGLNLSGVIEDEAAIGFDKQQYSNIDPCIRRPGKFKFHVTISTPRLGNEYYNIVHGEGHSLLTNYSMRDNPHLPVGLADSVSAEMSPQQAQREIDGLWVALEGMIWKGFDAKPYPFGNIHEHVHDRSKPYYLFFDIGVASSAWLLVQRLSNDLWVITAEYTPKRDGSVATVLREIVENYGNPCRIVVGADVNTRDSAGGETPMFFIRKCIGGDVPVTPIEGWIADKEIQLEQLGYLLRSTDGKRRLCVSKKLQSNNPETKRGVMELFREDQWPEDRAIKRGELLPKDGRLEHVRDALLYGAVGAMAVPKYSYTKNVAA